MGKNYNGNSWEDFKEFIDSLDSQVHDYNSIAEALADGLNAFEHYYAHKHGLSGFQVSWAELTFLKKSRGLEAPFMIVDTSKLLFPQYDLKKEIYDFVEESKPELAALAKKKLVESGDYANPTVVQRWKEIAEYTK